MICLPNITQCDTEAALALYSVRHPEIKGVATVGNIALQTGTYSASVLHAMIPTKAVCKRRRLGYNGNDKIYLSLNFYSYILIPSMGFLAILLKSFHDEIY